jgi:SAM-dependent methyltransferase
MLTLFPRIRPNPVMPPPLAPAGEQEAAAAVPPSEVAQPNPRTALVSPRTTEISEPSPPPRFEERAEVFSTDSPASNDPDSRGDAAPDAKTSEAGNISERNEIDSSLIEGPEMVAAFLSSLKDATSKEVAEPAAARNQVEAPGVAIAATNIFDEIEMLHEADARAPVDATARTDDQTAQVTPGTLAEAAPEANQTESSEGQNPADLAPSTFEQVVTVVESAAQTHENVAEPVRANEVSAAEVAQETAARPVAAPIRSATPDEPVKTSEADRAAPVRPVKRKRPEGLGFFELERIPEPEVMEDSGEVQAYASAAAQSHLDAIDDTFVAHAQLLLKGRERGRALDIGTGPGQIVLKLGYPLTRWKFLGVDRSTAMVEKAQEGLASAPELAGRVEFLIADGNRLDFPDASFDLVVCNSVLHHLGEPQNLFSEIARLVKPDGAILLRDLRRPSRFEFGGHIRRHGKHYSGEMKRLYIASVRAAYTSEELEKMVLKSKLRGVRVFRHGKTHIGFEREAKARP